MKQLLFLSLGLLLFSCSGKRNIESFYFPHKELYDGLVYEYRAPNGGEQPPFYMYYRTVRTDTSIYLTAMQYNDRYIPTVFTREELLPTGVLLEEMYLYEPDSTGRQEQLEVEILANNVFPFRTNPDDPGVLVWEARWHPPAELPTTLTLLRNRQFVRDTVVEVKGQPTEAVVFAVRELMDHEQVGHLETEYGGREVYAEGIGLVYYRKNISEDFVVEYELTDRYPMTELEDRARREMQR